MAFSNNRGRPRKNLNDKDLGTKELQSKRKLNQTLEPLDIIYNKNLINENQYNAANKLRWLYSLKYGVASVSAYDHTRIGGKNLKYIDLKWLSEKEKELDKALNLLKLNSYYNLICDICIFLKYTSFRYISNNNSSMQICVEKIQDFRNGLDLLCVFFNKNKSHIY